jgi:hypothetical protein
MDGTPAGSIARLLGDLGSAEPLPFSLDLVPGVESWSLLLSGEPGRDYAIDTSPDLIEWQAWTNVTATASPLTIPLPLSPATPQEFYRASTP